MKNNKLVKLISSFIIGVMFILAVLSVLIVTGVISFGKSEITLQTGSKESLYNGSPLTNHEIQMVGELKEGHRIEYEFISSQTEVGECPNELQYKIFDELDADVTADYNVKHEYGMLKVNPRIVLVICEDTGGRVPQGDQYTVDEESYDGLVFDHKLVFREMTAEELSNSESSGGENSAGQTGSKKNKWKPVIYDRKNNDVTANYHIIVNVNVNNDSDAIYDPEDLADKIFDSDSNMIPPVGNENTVLFLINADNANKAYLKLESYGDYTGQEWRSARYYNNLIDNRYSAAYLTGTALENGGAENYNMSIISQCGKYALPYYLSPSGENEVQLSDTQVSGNAGSEYKSSYYPFSSSAKLPTDLAEYEGAYAEFVDEQYLTIDDETLEYMNEIIKREGFDASDPEIIVKVAKYIQGSAEYNLEYDRDLDEESNVAIAFLDYYKEGVCSHYSTAAALLYRALGIPARYTVGVVAYPDGNDYVEVPAKNAHAWVEVYIDGLGWIYVEVTGVVAGNNVEVGQSPTGASECELYGHDMLEIDAKEPTCTEIGWTEHLECQREECDYKEGYEEIDELGHDIEFVKSIEPTCTDDGHESYYRCSRCDCLWSGDTKQPIDEVPVLGALGHDKKFIDYLDSTCVDVGHEAHCICSRCDAVWAGDGETPIDEIPIIPAKGHDLEEHEGVEETCVDDGFETYYVCRRCGWMFASDGQTRIEEIKVIKAHHIKNYVNAAAPTCLKDGNEAYYKCERCDVLWDEEGNEIDEAPILDALGHDPGDPDPEDHCNVKCQRESCKILLEENQHPDFAPDPNDGYKVKCINCGDEKREQTLDGEPNPNRLIYTVITSTSNTIYLRETSKNYVGNGFVAVPEFCAVYEGVPYSPNYLASLVASNSGAALSSITIVESVCGDYGLPTYFWLGDGYEIQINDVTYEGSVDEPYTVPYFEYDFLYGATPTVPDDPAYRALEEAYREFVYKAYLGLDADTEKFAKKIVESEGWSYNKDADYATKMDVIRDVANFIRAYREYDTTFKTESFVGAKNWSEVFFDKDTYPDAKAVCRHYAVSAVVIYKALGIPARYVAGVSVQGEPGKMTDIYEDRGHAWVEIYIDGIGWIAVEVTGSSSNGQNPEVDNRPQVNLQVGDAEVQYQNGEKVYYEGSFVIQGEEVESIGLPEGYSCEYKVMGWATEPGKHRVIQAYSVVIKDKNGNVVTDQYKINKFDGILHVYRDILYFESDSYERVFDGKTPTEGVVWQIGGTLEPGYVVQDPIFTGSLSVGEVLNSFKIKISDGENDVTDEYLIRTAPGTVTTKPKPITFTAGSAEKVWDGTPLTCDDILYEEGALVAGHWLDLEYCVVEGSETEPNDGESENNFIKTVVIRDAEGKNVTDWYEKTYKPGKLVILLPNM